jgi:hypothetical protein
MRYINFFKKICIMLTSYAHKNVQICTMLKDKLGRVKRVMGIIQLFYNTIIYTIWSNDNKSFIN